ncbi:MAG: lipopolysaccharide assembly protein LapA domain-containing protein [Paraglaciecola sp.]|uniref:LapA family protein n=1 Tax=Paraglaciecola sp. TaxID=1920173 RepID=UPI003262D06D
MKVKGLVLLIFILMMLIIAGFIGTQNGHVVLVNYLLAETEVKMSTVLVSAFMLGFGACFTGFIYFYFRMKWKITALTRKNKKLSQQVIDK